SILPMPTPTRSRTMKWATWPNYRSCAVHGNRHTAGVQRGWALFFFHRNDKSLDAQSSNRPLGRVVPVARTGWVRRREGHMVSYCAGIWRRRYFWLSLVKMDLRKRYRGSVLGLGWSLLQPLAMTAIFTVVFATLFNADPLSYAPYVLTGLACWNFI